MGISYFFLWWDPVFLDGSTEKAIWFLIILLFYNTFHTTYTVPYTALTPDLTEDYDERTTLTMYRQFFGIVSRYTCSLSYLSAHLIFMVSSSTPYTTVL